MPGVVKGLPQGGHPAIHHVARRHDISPCSGMTNCLLTQNSDRLVIQNLAVFHQSVVPVLVIRVERDVRHHNQFRMRCFESFDRSRNQTTRIITFLGPFRLQFLFNRRKQYYRGNPECQGLPGFLHQTLKGPTRASWHRFNCLVHLLIMKKQGQDKVPRAQQGFTNQSSHSG